MNQRSRDRRPQQEESNFIEKTVAINRVAKVVKGGRRFSFSAIVVLGDGEGQVGIGSGKANEVPEAIRKATEYAKRSMMRVPLAGRTVPHYVTGTYGSTTVVLRPASPGTGVIAGAAVRAILDAAGYQNVLTKLIGSNNPHNVVKAVFNALAELESPEQYAVRTGRELSQVLQNYTVTALASAGPPTAAPAAQQGTTP